MMSAAILDREPHPERARREDDPQRDAILVAAERLFREIGYRKTTVADIARVLRMSPANVYRFFDSKKAINEGVAERLIDDLHGELVAIADRTDEPVADRLRAVLLTHFRLSEDRFTSERRMHDMVEAAIVESWQVIHRHIEFIADLLSRLVAEGAARGEFRVDDPRLAALCVQTAFVRFCHPALIVQCADEPGPGPDAMVAFVLRALGWAGGGASSQRRETACGVDRTVAVP